MKKLNTVKFIAEATRGFDSWVKSIDGAEDLEEARKRGNAAIGYIDCMTVFLNTMIDKENNDFTEELDEMLEEWTVKVYNHMADKAHSCGDMEAFTKYAKQAREHAE